jgi:hypothetical protein
MPVNFWEQVGIWSSDEEALSQGVAVRRVNTWRTQAQNSSSVQSRYIVNSAGGFLPCGGSVRPLPRLIYRSPLTDGFSSVMNFAVITTKAVCAPEDKRKPATKFDWSHLQIFYYKYEALAVENCIYCSIIFIVFIIKYVYNNECCLHLTKKGKGWGALTKHQFHIILRQNIHTHSAHAWTTTPTLQATQSSYKVPSDPEPKTSCKDTAEWSEHLQWTKQLKCTYP